MMESNIVYIAIGAHGLADPHTYAVLMSSFPDVAAEEWLPEPDGVAELEVESGEMIFSAILSPAGQHDLLEEIKGNGRWNTSASSHHDMRASASYGWFT
ncbi:hypothetical protein [Paenarthrobacter nicotinovorans]|uniref:hypothetical protein n=1 Tax=Paenarthrobacter nicotinovorans TaxID=29320 RepID=UPI0024859C40|nr:hypothetical protein [Paenarthrobacter nicotinovorans]MDI2020003.1 hypothetical protein [Paenarthrobacter nicotinovorans]